MDMDIEAKVRSIIKEHVGIEGDTDNIGVDDELADWGLNSTGILKLISGIEEKFGFVFEDEDFDSRNFQTIASIIKYIEDKCR